MLYMICFALLSACHLDDKPEASFVASNQSSPHIALVKSGGADTVNFKVRFYNLANKEAYAKVRCLEPESQTEHISIKKVNLKNMKETWEFFYRVPTFKNDKYQAQVIYQIEIGYFDMGSLDIEQVLDSVAWQYSGNGVKPAKLLSVPERILQITGTSWRITSLTKGDERIKELRIGFAQLNNIPQDGTNLARKINP